MINRTLNIIKLIKYNLSIGILVLLSTSISADDNTNFRQVETTGRAVLISGDIETSRKRALELSLIHI